MRILITSGGTREPIDDVRFITNFSTGSTGARLTELINDHNLAVTYVHSKGSKLPNDNVRMIEYETFNDLDFELRKILENESFDWIIHAAAVGDYSLDKVIINNIENEPGELKKISSEGELNLKFKRNFKIIAKLKSYSKNKNVKIVGFKLTNSTDTDERLDKVRKVSENPGVVAVIHNDMADIKKNERIFAVYQNMERADFVSSIDDLGFYLKKMFIGESR